MRPVCAHYTISIHAPHARSDKSFFIDRTFTPISIHAPHARSDNSDGDTNTTRFISIHAPHARSDTGKVFVLLNRLNFDPRSSCEERQAL